MGATMRAWTNGASLGKRDKRIGRLLSDRDIKDEGNKDMYSKAFDGKRNGGNCAEGLLFDTAVGGDAVGFDLSDVGY